MFDVHCPRHRGRVLLGPWSIEGLAQTELGLGLQWRCHCGATGTRHFGRPAAGHLSTLDPAVGPAA